MGCAVGFYTRRRKTPASLAEFATKEKGKPPGFTDGAGNRKSPGSSGGFRVRMTPAGSEHPPKTPGKTSSPERAAQNPAHFPTAAGSCEAKRRLAREALADLPEPVMDAIQNLIALAKPKE
jgi:hypothetical protein